MTNRTNRRLVLIRASMIALLFVGVACDTPALAQATPEMRARPVTTPGATCPTWDGNSSQANAEDPVMLEPTLEGLKTQMLRVHNDARAAVHVEPMIWDDGLAAKSLEYAQRLIQNNNSALIHSTDRVGIGENLSGGNSTALGNRFGAVRLANLWVREGFWYQADNASSYKCDSQAEVGHYVQIVWRNTRRFGCGYAVIGNSRLLACRYGPGGNISGERAYPAGDPRSWQNLSAVQFAETDTARSCNAQVNKDEFGPAIVEALNCARSKAGITTKLTLDPALAQQAQTSADARGALDNMWSYPAVAGATEVADNSYDQTPRNPAAVVYERAVTNSPPVWVKAATDVASTIVGCGWSASPATLNSVAYNARRIVVCRFK